MYCNYGGKGGNTKELKVAVKNPDDIYKSLTSDSKRAEQVNSG